ncbi:MAG: aminotransferase class III-fold pyridoxal phosphate-dependent enzyme, partial [Chloroflexi bacterium]|nr:aminotransferase class III-fold pyridoxal phosphate-dependent enzyme [Chloroflexota bacterium]
MSTTEELLKWDKEYVIHPMGNVGDPPGKIIEESHGIYIKYSDGKECIDGASSLTCVNLGYSQKEITDAVAKQMNKLPFTNTFFDLCNPPNIECSNKLAELTPKGLKHFTYTCGGSESIDCSFRVARTYWKNKGAAGKYKIISLFNAYHGVNFGAAPATTLRQGAFGSYIQPLSSGFIHVPSYYCYRCALGKNYPECDMECIKFLAYTIENEGRDSVAAVLAEPVHGTAGCITPPPEFWPKLRKLCSDLDVLLIADEVMTGFGRTGKMFATENWNIVPDLMAIAKGLTSAYLPFGAVAVSDKVFEGLKGAPIYGFTYSGHPVCSAAATKAMEIYIRDKVVENSAEQGKYALERLNK